MKPPFAGELCLVKNKPLLDFPVGLVVKTPRFHCGGQIGLILIRGLRSHLPPDVAKKKGGLKNEPPFLRGHTQTHTHTHRHTHAPGPSSAHRPAPLSPEGICSVVNLCSRASPCDQKTASLQLRSLSCLDLYYLPCLLPSHPK